MFLSLLVLRNSIFGLITNTVNNIRTRSIFRAIPKIVEVWDAGF